jgi:organic radical activating enzyme
MFGRNEPRGRTHGDILQYHAVFYTIQGEGPYSGDPAVFIRLTGCNLRCWFCFVPSTPIKMADGSSKRIDQVEIGDLLMSWDGEGFAPRRVTQTMQSVADHILRVEVDNRSVWCTPEHPFLTSEGWVEAKDLTPGTKLVYWDVHSRMKLLNPGRLGRPTDDMRRAASERLAKLWKDPEFRAAGIKRMTESNPMKDPTVAARSFASRDAQGPSGYEKAVLRACEGLPVTFCGDGSFPVAHKFPDFVVDGQAKLIEVWAADADFAHERNDAWQERRRALFAKHGFDTLMLPLTQSDLKLDNLPRIREHVAQFIHNGAVVKSVTEVGPRALARLYSSASAPKLVYNLEVEGTHTYCANTLVVHNCDTEWGDESDPHAKSEEIARIAMREADGRTDLAVITGGEPTRQDLGELFHWLMRYGFKRIQVETAGTFWQDCLDWPGVTLVVSPKTSKVHEEYRKRSVNWKYVLKAGEVDPDDGLPSAPMQRHRDGNTLVGGAPARPNRGDLVFLQPVDEHLGSHEHNANLGAVRDSALRFGYRAGLQVHKFLGVD